MPSELTLSGKYYVSKLEVIITENTSHPDTTFKNITFLTGETFVDHSLPSPFDSIVVGDFYMDFEYSTVRLNWVKRDYVGRDIWEYGAYENGYIFPNLQEFGEIVYHRDVYSYNQYDLGTIYFLYKPKKSQIQRTVRFHVDSDLLTTLQLSGFEIWPYGKNGPKMRLIISLIRT